MTKDANWLATLDVSKAAKKSVVAELGSSPQWRKWNRAMTNKRCEAIAQLVRNDLQSAIKALELVQELVELAKEEPHG